MKNLFTNRIYYTLTSITAAHILASLVVWSLLACQVLQVQPSSMLSFTVALFVVSPAMSAIKARWYPGTDRGWKLTRADLVVILAVTVLEVLARLSSSTLWELIPVSSALQPAVAEVLYLALYASCAAMFARFLAQRLVPSKVSVQF